MNNGYLEFLAHFVGWTDPREDRGLNHQLLDIVGLALCGTISGANSCADIERSAKGHIGWLGRFLELPFGVPSMTRSAGSLTVWIRPSFRSVLESGWNSCSSNSKGRRSPLPEKHCEAAMQKMMERAGLKPGPAVFKSLRSSALIDVEREFGSTAENEWIGHGDPLR
jgi:hypothetical protein